MPIESETKLTPTTGFYGDTFYTSLSGKQEDVQTITFTLPYTQDPWYPRSDSIALLPDASSINLFDNDRLPENGLRNIAVVPRQRGELDTTDSGNTPTRISYDGFDVLLSSNGDVSVETTHEGNKSIDTATSKVP